MSNRIEHDYATVENCVLVRRLTTSDRKPLAHMLELYQHDLSNIWDRDLRDDGTFGYALEKFFDPPECPAFILSCAGKYAGFALVDNSVCLAENELWMSQFFVMKKYRHRGVGKNAAIKIFDLLPGKWEIGQMAQNHSAHSFWIRVIGEYTKHRFIEHVLDNEVWRGWLQCFDNRAANFENRSIGARPAQ